MSRHGSGRGHRNVGKLTPEEAKQRLPGLRDQAARLDRKSRDTTGKESNRARTDAEAVRKQIRQIEQQHPDQRQ